MKRIDRIFALSVTLAVAPLSALAQQPLSAIDWLDKQPAITVAQPVPVEPTVPTDEPPVSDSAQSPGVEVTPLGDARPDAVGLLPSTTTGLPGDLWAASDQASLIKLLQSMPSHPLPAIQALNYTLLLAEADAPKSTLSDAAFLRARVHALVGYGAVEPARALIERAGPENAILFDTWLSLTLLTGDEDAPCAVLRNQPQLSRDYGARVYCIARAGDWDTAALTYDTAVALGNLRGAEADLLAQYLDPEVIETTAIPTPPSSPSPLVFRLYETSGAPLPTRTLPIAFSMADLRGNSGWKPELEAAERLARTGALDPSRLLGIYTERRAAASGGVWDRVAALQDFETSLSQASVPDIVATLPDAWEAAQSQSLEVPFARLFTPRLARLELNGETRVLADQIALLSPDYEIASAKITPRTPRDRLLVGLARGMPDPADATTEMERAIVRGFATNAAALPHKSLIENGKLGEAILNAAQDMGTGQTGSEAKVTDAIATLRAVGLEDAARRAALQILLLPPPT
ncbi:MAG: hypothetical protein AB8B82_17215 [Roseovarius sp.]